jgi:hypothetical protein
MATQYTLIRFGVELLQVASKSFPATAIPEIEDMTRKPPASARFQPAEASQSCKVSRRLVFELTAQR